jgi:hypothetical protein
MEGKNRAKNITRFRPLLRWATMRSNSPIWTMYASGRSELLRFVSLNHLACDCGSFKLPIDILIIHAAGRPLNKVGKMKRDLPSGVKVGSTS